MDPGTGTRNRESVMCNAQMLRKHHQGLHQMANELEKCLSEKDARARLQVTILWLSRMTGLLAFNLALEDKVMYPRMIGHRDWEVGSRARAFQFEVGGLRNAFDAYRRRWSRPAGIEADWEGFARETRDFLTALRSRIGLEEKEIYSLLEKVAT
jgi:hypothetical protein